MNATSVKIKFVKMKKFNISRSMKNENLQAEEHEILVAEEIEILVAVEMENLVADEMENLVGDDPDLDYDHNKIPYVAAQPYDAAS